MRTKLWRARVRLNDRRVLSRQGPAAFADRWWYYTVELAPGVMAKGLYADDVPMLPRMLMRRIDLQGADCLDVGCMEGLIPVLMRRRGARRVLAVDHDDANMAKLRAIQAAYRAPFDFQAVGAVDGLHTKISGGFDFVNCSGLLYHVFSPLHVLAGLRPLLKRNGLAIVSTNVVLDDGMYAEFNDAGRMQEEAATFWYPTVRLLEYLLRYMRLEPVDALLMPHPESHSGIRYGFDKPSGYLAVLCRAVERADADPWMERSAAESWEYHAFSDWSRADRQPVSCLGDGRVRMALADMARVTVAADSRDAHTLHLDDES